MLLFHRPCLTSLFLALSFFSHHSPSHASAIGMLDPNEILGSVDLRELSRALARRREDEARELEAIVDNADDFVRNLMECRRIPGLSLSVVRADKVLIQKGYGVSDIRREVSQNDESSTCIGSGTKPFVALLLGILLEEQSHRFPHKWDTRVKDVMRRDFHFADDLRTEETTIRDLLAHRVGFLDYEGTWLVGLEGTHSREDYCRRLWKLKPAADLRTTYTYSNFMYLLSACVAEKLGGFTFEHLMRKRVLEPLNMHGSFFISEAEDAVLPKSYLLNQTTGLLHELDTMLLRTVSPADSAGGLCTTAKDMTHWLQLQLRDGQINDDVELLGHRLWSEMHESQMFLKPAAMPISKPYFPVTDEHTSQGLGWTLGTYRGYKYVRHGGTVSGFGSLMTVFKDVDLAIFSSINGPMTGGTANDVLHYHLVDALLSLDPWLDEVASCTFPSPWSLTLPSPRSSASQRFADRKRLNSNDPHQALQAKRILERERHLGKMTAINDNQKYTGNYGHLLFGNMTVFYDDSLSQLKIRFGQIGMGHLQFHSEFIWSIVFEGPLYFLTGNGSPKKKLPLLSFMSKRNGKFCQIQALGYEKKAHPVFHRDLQWTDPEPDEQTTGDF
ncbi:hypothetical protein CAPTEDRAFT_185994 [Capitella teleta]|uniref:Beta-lactamase-related domain-containing protein n=1 Tax=Capitella teleta TaxID=283909 RepID=R7VL41_CAPTE|nr:hypothetical protein CAPTEDRAFT_185994 [Capitella teleta]|eukprot:ELU17941.1 hypothetical protein CAPTEDRAFT_185994 [Capitella teleta]